MSEKSYLEKLNINQYMVATTIDGPLLVIAGAGTGKTTAIISRVAYMLDNDISGSQILLMTFTNKAAKEMQTRIRNMVGAEANSITACTFHSFCANFLRKYAKLAGLDNNFTVIDSSDASEAISLVREDFFDKQKNEFFRDYDLKEFPSSKKIHEIISQSANCKITIAEATVANKMSRYRNEIEAIANHYIIYKKERKIIDYDDLLVYTEYVLNHYETTRSIIDHQYTYKMVDEYQDTNKIQDAILDLICLDSKNIAVIGDANQSIYGFRGAEVENILTFESRHPHCKTIQLTENYRSTQEILDLTNAVMRYSSKLPVNDLYGQFHGTKPSLIVAEDNHEECQFIIDSIKYLVANGEKTNNIAVIVRSARQSFELEMNLTKAGIGFDKFGGVKFFEKKIIKNILSYVRVGLNPADEIALYRILQLYPGIGTATAKKIAALVKEKGIAEINTASLKWPKIAHYLKEIFFTINYIQTLSIKEQLEYLFSYYDSVAERAIEAKKISDIKKADEKNNKNKEMDEAIILLDMVSEHHDARKFLEDIVLESSTEKQSKDKLNITTIHSAKGLEYNYVFLMDVAQGITPKTKKGDTEDQEELRCFYTAITRAKKGLQMYVAKYHTSWMGGIEGELSHFLNNNNILSKIETNASAYEIQKLTFNSL